MIKPVNDIINLCGKNLRNFSDYENRLLIYNYIYYTKGVIKEEVMSTKFDMTTKAKLALYKAYNYFNNYYESIM